MPDALQRVFDACTPASGGEWVKIERLEIDLGEVSPEMAQGQWLGRFEEKLEAVLAEKLAGWSAAQQRQGKAKSDLDALISFLQTGSLPWWELPELFDPDELLVRLVREQPDSLAATLRQLASEPNALRRLALQFGFESLLPLLQLPGAPPISENEAQQWLPEEIIQRLFRRLAQNPETEARQGGLPEEKSQRLHRRTAQKPEDDFLEKKHLPTGLSGGAEVAGESNVLSLFEKNENEVFGSQASQKTLVESSGERARDLKQAVFASEQTALSSLEPSPEKYILRYAGLVLAAPFLPAFFRATGLLEGNQFKDRKAAWQGMFLLHCLATGELRAPEFALTLEKLLVGLPLEEPIPTQVELDEPALAETEELLRAIVAHWKSLKNTSPAGLREAFFKRDGTLERNQTPNSWLLRVERKAYDVLLDTIPWGFSMIKLPWSEQLIHVEW